MRKAIEYIKEDKRKNGHPKNRLFIYAFRIGQYLCSKESVIAKMGLKIDKLLLKVISNGNQIPIETSIGGGYGYRIEMELSLPAQLQLAPIV